MDKIKQSIGLANSVIMVAENYIKNIELKREEGVETYSDMQKLLTEAWLLKKSLEPQEEQFDQEKHPGLR